MKRAKLIKNPRVVLALAFAGALTILAAVVGINLMSGSDHSEDRTGPSATATTEPPESVTYRAKAADGEFHGYLEITVDKAGNVSGKYIWISWTATGVQETHTEPGLGGYRKSASVFMLRGGGLQESGMETQATVEADGDITLSPTPSGVQVPEWTRTQRADFDAWVAEYDQRVMAPCRAKAADGEYDPCGNVG